MLDSTDHVHAQASPAGQAAAFFEDLLKVYTPRRVCMFEEQPLIWLHVLSDLLIGLSYYSIPFALVYFIRRRRDLAFSWIFWLFALFILACGTTHMFGVVDIWRPMYKVDGLVRLATAIISVGTAVVLWPLLPKALALPSPAQLEGVVRDRTAELARANQALRDEMEARAEVEKERERLLESERAARAEAERASRMKDEFLATLSHELRTPLNAILGWSYLLQQKGEVQGHGELSNGLGVIARNARAQAQLVEDLLDMSGIISGKVRLDVQRVDLADVIGEAVEAVEPAVRAKGITLHKVLDPLAGPVTGDPARLRQVVWNLLSNAVKFTPKGGRVQVFLERINSHVEITVTDTGIGIQPELIPYVFDRFRQADSSSTRRFGGLGLGLAIVRHLVELHGGQVSAESAGEGRGAAFTVVLPLRAVREVDGLDDRFHPGAPGPEGGETAVSLSGLKVLVVDDEPDTRDLLLVLLEGAGATVRTAGSSAEAFERLQAERPDVLVCDIGMPDEDGYVFIRRVRKLGPATGGNLPAVALTAFARPEDRKMALMAGFQMHMPKPVDPAELLIVVASLAGRTRQEQEGAR